MNNGLVLRFTHHDTHVGHRVKACISPMLGAVYFAIENAILTSIYRFSESSHIVISSDWEINTSASRASLSAQHGPVSEKSKPKTFLHARRRKQEYLSSGIFKLFAPVSKVASHTQQDSPVSSDTRLIACRKSKSAQSG